MPRKAAVQQARLADVVCNRALSLTASVYDVSVAEIVRPTQGSPQASTARHVAIYLAHLILDALSLEDLAELFGRTKSTALHAVRRVEEMRDDPKIDQTLTWLEAIL